MFELIGHSETEAKELCGVFMDGAKKRAVITGYAKLGEPDRKVVDDLITQGKPIEEVVVKIMSVFGKDDFGRLLSGTSYIMMEEYMSEIKDKLDDNQKEKLAKIIHGD